MKKIRYQNRLRQMFWGGQRQDEADKENAGKPREDTKLVHADWLCKVPAMRLKFLPDFETLKKPGFGFISKLSLNMSNKSLIFIPVV